MREIKFRAWNGKEMSKTFTISDIANQYDMGYFVEYGGELEFSVIEEEIILMQFTGLLDKNGKEIFEGDMVNYSYYRDTKSQVTFSEAVEWNDLKDTQGFEIHTGMECEVIGNIYENPELLEGK